MTVGYGDGAIGVIEAGFVSPNPFTIELFGTEGSPELHPTPPGVLRVCDGEGGARGPCRATPTTRSRAGSTTSATGTRADDNLDRAVELTRLVVAANDVGARRTAPIAYSSTETVMIKVGLHRRRRDRRTRTHARLPAHADRIGVTAVADAVPRRRAPRASELGATAYADYRAADRRGGRRRGRHLPAAPPAPRRDRRGRRGRPAHPVREAAVPDRGGGGRGAQSRRRAGVTLMCAHNQLFLPAVAEAKAVLEAGTIGRVYEVRTTDSFYNDFDPANMGWRASAATSGGGELIDTGYHPTYLLLHLAGGAPGRGHRDALDAPARRSWRARTPRRCSSGSTTGSSGRWRPAGPTTRPPVTERFSAVGERGALHSDGTALTVAAARRGDDDADVRSGRHSSSPRSATSPTASRTGARPLHTEHEGIEALGIILAAYEAARTRRVAPVIRA